MADCRECKNPLADGAAYCGACGVKAGEKKPPSDREEKAKAKVRGWFDEFVAEKEKEKGKGKDKGKDKDDVFGFLA